MRRVSLQLLCAIAVFSLSAAGALAVPLTWTISNAAFGDGGTASGTFVYDADTNTFSNINITTTTGSVRSGASYSFVCTAPCNGVIPNSSQSLMLTLSSASDQTGAPGFAIFFTQPLSNVGGNRGLSGLEATCSNATCTAPTGASRSLNTGVVTAPITSGRPVPAMSEISLGMMALLLAIAGVLGLSRRRAR